MTTREQYLKHRAAISKKLGAREVFSVADAWPLYAGGQNIARYFFIGHLFYRTVEVPGDVAEFGCWRGSTTSFLAKMMAYYYPRAQKRVHGFDSFEGFDRKVQKAKGLRSGYKGNQAELELLLALDGLREKVVLHVGDICHTTTTTVGTHPARLSFAYIDCDVYEPCRAALEYVHPRLSQGGLIVFDEYGDPAWPGETQAADEFLDQYGHHYRQEATPVPQPSLVLVRV